MRRSQGGDATRVEEPNERAANAAQIQLSRHAPDVFSSLSELMHLQGAARDSGVAAHTWPGREGSTVVAPGRHWAKPWMSTKPTTTCRQISATAAAPSASQLGPNQRLTLRATCSWPLGVRAQSWTHRGGAYFVG
jgi:hypothetical protein